MKHLHLDLIGLHFDFFFSQHYEELLLLGLALLLSSAVSGIHLPIACKFYPSHELLEVWAICPSAFMDESCSELFDL